MDGRAYNKLSDGKLIGVFNRTGRKIVQTTIGLHDLYQKFYTYTLLNLLELDIH